MTGAQFTAWLQRMDWPDSKLASILEVSRNTIAKYKVEGSPVAIDYACEALERRQMLEAIPDKWMGFYATHNGKELMSSRRPVRTRAELNEAFADYTWGLAANHKGVDVTECTYSIAPALDPSKDDD